MSLSPLMECSLPPILEPAMRFEDLGQIEISDRLHRDLPAPLAAQTAHASLFIGVQRGLQAGRFDCFRKIQAVDHDHTLSHGGADLSIRRVSAWHPS